MTPDEARMIMNGWSQNHSQLALVGEFPGVALALRCHIGLVTEEGTIIVETAERGRIVLDFSLPGFDFRYSEPREFPSLVERHSLSSEEQYASGLTVFFPPTIECGDDSGTLHFSELLK